jgi:hypothetical protein
MNNHLCDYLQKYENYNLHSRLTKYVDLMSTDIKECRHLILYGPGGVGKYTQALNIISKYSPSNLKYEKKLIHPCNKLDLRFKLSDVHLEVDFGLLGCNAKLIWNELFTIYTDIVATRPTKTGFILCKNFHEIHNDLLEAFYSYIQCAMYKVIDIKFIILTESLSFIPSCIIDACEVLNIPRPSKNKYKQLVKLPPAVDITKISNIQSCVNNTNNINTNIILCNKIVDYVLKPKDINFVELRDVLYDLLIYGLNINNCIYYIFSKVLFKIKDKYLNELVLKTYVFFKYYNNNYRPIYHLESYIYYLISIIHEYE